MVKVNTQINVEIYNAVSVYSQHNLFINELTALAIRMKDCPWLFIASVQKKNGDIEMEIHLIPGTHPDMIVSLSSSSVL